ncbi:radical SAM superfamily protein [Ruminiclostridium hungatei]|uniref:Radical SAM superfamily protein n=1 Tax=Ruminiclostridium hungatei TaxID=48256 RepID=A0A1V4SH19_RUMHU|nr:radical SAM protein [Ruminiclostridium hungatei]OPX43160.1 radical SAM superfamily protein [Ruminiclostridium hungatei]
MTFNTDARELKVLLVRPGPHAETIGLQYVMKVEPLELEVLAAVLPENCCPVIADMIMEKASIEEIIHREKPQVVCVTGYITNVPEMLEYCRLAKVFNSGIVTICGGVHCEVCPEDLESPYVDFRVIRETITSFRKLFGHIQGSGPKPEGVLGIKETSGLPLAAVDPASYPVFPRRDLTEKYRDKYFYIFHHPVALLKTAFGCPYSCNFCFCRKITGGRYAERALEQVIAEIESIAEEHIYIVDDDFLFSRERLTGFIEALRERKIRKTFLVYGRADFIAKNPDIIKSFREVGLKTVIVGIESVFEQELAAYSKNTSLEINREAIRVLKENSVDCFATVILSPDWGREEFVECGRQLRDMGITYVNLQPFTPLPGTDIRIPDSEVTVSRQDYHKWDLAHVTVRPKKLSEREYYGEIIRLYRRILFRPGTIFGYIRTYPIKMLLKMLLGSTMVYRQYRQKMKEAGHA